MDFTSIDYLKLLVLIFVLILVLKFMFRTLRIIRYRKTRNYCYKLRIRDLLVENKINELIQFIEGVDLSRSNLFEILVERSMFKFDESKTFQRLNKEASIIEYILTHKCVDGTNLGLQWILDKFGEEVVERFGQNYLIAMVFMPYLNFKCYYDDERTLAIIKQLSPYIDWKQRFDLNELKEHKMETYIGLLSKLGFYPQTLKFIVDQGVNVNAPDINGVQPIHNIAAFINKRSHDNSLKEFESLEVLLEAGSSLHSEAVNGITSLQILSDAMSHPFLNKNDELKSLINSLVIEYGGNFAKLSSNGHSARDFSKSVRIDAIGYVSNDFCGVPKKLYFDRSVPWLAMKE